MIHKLSISGVGVQDGKAFVKSVVVMENPTVEHGELSGGSSYTSIEMDGSGQFGMAFTLLEKQNLKRLGIVYAPLKSKLEVNTVGNTPETNQENQLWVSPYNTDSVNFLDELIKTGKYLSVIDYGDLTIGNETSPIGILEQERVIPENDMPVLVEIRDRLK